jgi:hypothetical protein
LHFFALSVTTSLKIPGAVIPRRVFTRPGSFATGSNQRQASSAMPPIATKNGEPLKRRRANGYNFSNRFPQTPPVVETSAMHPLILLTFLRQLRKLG